MVKKIFLVLCTFLLMFTLLVPVGMASAAEMPSNIPKPPIKEEYGDYGKDVFIYMDMFGDINAITYFAPSKIELSKNMEQYGYYQFAFTLSSGSKYEKAWSGYIYDVPSGKWLENSITHLLYNGTTYGCNVNKNTYSSDVYYSPVPISLDGVYIYNPPLSPPFSGGSGGVNTPSSTPIEQPADLPAGDYGNNYAMWVENGAYYCAIDFITTGDSVEASGAGYRVNFSVTGRSTVYRHNGTEWRTTGSVISGSSYFTIQQQDHLIHYPKTLQFNGEDFFPRPLSLAEAIQGAVMELLQTFLKTMMILAGSAVLLMALWIGLDLFGKVLRPFLP